MNNIASIIKINIPIKISKIPCQNKFGCKRIFMGKIPTSSVCNRCENWMCFTCMAEDNKGCINCLAKKEDMICYVCKFKKIIIICKKCAKIIKFCDTLWCPIHKEMLGKMAYDINNGYYNICGHLKCRK